MNMRNDRSLRTGGVRSAANRFALDYRAEADRLGPPPVPIFDGHAHINGGEAAAVWRDACEHFGVRGVLTQTQLAEAPAVRQTLGDLAQFVAVPEYMSPDRAHAHRDGYLDNIRRWHGEFGARMLKFWCAPRGRDMGAEVGVPDLLNLDTPWRREQMDLALSLGMRFMAHIADPDTWFATKYADASVYGSKLDQYEPLGRLAREYDVDWLIAHMGGWPEDLGFVSSLLDRFPRFVIDTSATKWMVRELSKHPRAEFAAFLEKYRGRVIFGSDIVTMDAHLSPGEGPRGMGAAADSPEAAFDLYASRYWALRTMFETDYEGESNIADPDLALVEPERHGPMDAPTLRGFRLETGLLRELYRGAVQRWYFGGEDPTG